MKYDFDEVIERRDTFSMKWDYAEFLKTFGITERFDENTIPVHTADMDFRCAQPIADALKRLAEHNIYGYTAVFPYGIGLKYYEAITHWFQRRHNWTILPPQGMTRPSTVETRRCPGLLACGSVRAGSKTAPGRGDETAWPCLVGF